MRDWTSQPEARQAGIQAVLPTPLAGRRDVRWGSKRWLSELKVSTGEASSCPNNPVPPDNLGAGVATGRRKVAPWTCGAQAPEAGRTYLPEPRHAWPSSSGA